MLLLLAGRGQEHVADHAGHGDGEAELFWARPYWNLETRVAQRLWEWLSVYALGRNLTNAGDPTYLPLPPRSLQLGLEGRY